VTVTGGEASGDQGLCERQLERYLTMYRFGYELFVKAMFFYFVAVGAVGSYVFRTDASRSQQHWFLIVVIYTSLAASVGCSITLRWWNSMAQAIERSCNQLEVETIPIREGKYLIISVIVDCFLIVGACVAFLSTR
jgi:hypothetical protein